MAVKNVWKTFWFCGFSYSYLKDNSVFTVAKRDSKFYIGYVKGVLFIDRWYARKHA